MDELFPVTVVTIAAFGVSFVVDHLPDAWPSWTRVLASWLVSLGVVLWTKLDVMAMADGSAPTAIGYAMTSVVLAGLASKGVHPLTKSLTK